MFLLLIAKMSYDKALLKTSAIGSRIYFGGLIVFRSGCSGVTLLSLRSNREKNLGRNTWVAF